MSDRRSNPEQYQLRLPAGLRDRIKAVAEKNGRSLNAEIVARLEGVIDPDAEGWVRVWLPQDLIERIEHKASLGQTTADVEIRFALEEAFPYRATLGDYVRRLRRNVDKAGDDADPATVRFLEGAELVLRENPQLAHDTWDEGDRGYEVGPKG